MITRQSCVERDQSDPLASLRDQFELPDDVIYLDGNSLGALPRSVGPRLTKTVSEEWGSGLIRSWNSAGWIDLAQRIGDKIARIVGAGPGEVAVADSTSVNLYKVIAAAAELNGRDPGRSVVLSEDDNFPTDLYIAESAARVAHNELRTVGAEEIDTVLDKSVSVLVLTEVNYRTGRVHDMRRLTAAAHAVGALAVWDLSHSAGVLPIDLSAADADFAVGCGYKYLNGGPGAPAFVWVHPRYADLVSQPLAGWFGHADPFAFSTPFQPAPGSTRFQCGTPPILSLVALECGVDTVLAAESWGGIPAIRAKSIALTTLFIDLVEELPAEFGLTVASPRAAAERGSQVSLAHPTHGYEVMQALIDRQVIGDFRDPDIIRFGFSPLYTRFVDVWDAARHLAEVMAAAEWNDARYRQRARVT